LQLLKPDDADRIALDDLENRRQQSPFVRRMCRAACAEWKPEALGPALVSSVEERHDGRHEDRAAVEERQGANPSNRGVRIGKSERTPWMCELACAAPRDEIKIHRVATEFNGGRSYELVRVVHAHAVALKTLGHRAARARAFVETGTGAMHHDAAATRIRR